MAPKWQTFRDKTTGVKTPVKRRIEASSLSYPSPDSGTAEKPTCSSRPKGAKFAKTQARIKDLALETNQKLAAASQKMADEATRKNDMMERAADLRLFTRSLEGLDDEAREFLKLQRTLAFERLKAKQI